MTKKKLLESFETVLAVVGIAFYAGAFGFAPDDAAPILPKIILTLLRYSIWVTSTIFLLVRWRGALKTVKRDLILCLYIFILFFSFIWADEKRWIFSINLRDVLQVATFGLYFATSFSLRDQVRIIAISFGIQALGSVFVASIRPSIGVHTSGPHIGSWKGLYVQKNYFSSLMIVGLISFFSLSMESLKSRFYKWLGVFLFVTLIILSRSGTGFFILSFTTLLILLLQKLPRKVEIRIVSLSLGILALFSIIFLLAANWVQLVDMLGKDATLTGRIPLWTYCLNQLQNQDKFLLGFGSGQFFLPGTKTWVGAYYSSVGFFAPHPHNGYINILLDVGLLGFALLAITFIIALIRSMILTIYVTKYSLELLWPISFLIFMLLNNISETQTGGIFLILYMSIAFSVAKRTPVIISDSLGGLSPHRQQRENITSAKN